MSDVDKSLVKKPYQKIKLNLEQAIEYAKCKDETHGLHYFVSNYFYLQHPTQGRQIMSPFKYQWEMLDALLKYKDVVFMCGRQLGKTQTSAGYLLWYSIFHDDTYILVASKSQEDAIDVMHRIQFGYEHLPDWLRPGATNYAKKSVEWDNGSRIISVATTEKTGRGRSPSIIYCDELSFIRPTIAREFWASIQPGLSTGGKCIVTSTPSMPDDQFADIWNAALDRFDDNGNEMEVGRNGFKALKYTWKAHPDRDEAWASKELAKIGEERFRREHEVEFITFEETLISSTALAKSQGIDPIRKSGQVRWYKEPKRDNVYAVTLDPAMGTGGDYAAIQVYELPSMHQVAEWKDNKTIIENQVKIVKNIVDEILEKCPNSEIYWTYENNSLGEAVTTHIRSVGEDYVNAHLVNEKSTTRKRTTKGRKGLNTTNTKKSQACSKLKLWYESGKLKIYSKALLTELRAFIAKGVGYEAKLGYNDDLVSSTLLFIRVALHIAQWDDRCYEATAYEYDEEDREPMPILI